MTPDFQFPQDENPASPPWLAAPGLGLPLYLPDRRHGLQPTDTMPLTLTAKVMHGVQSFVSLVIVVLVTARAVNVLT